MYLIGVCVTGQHREMLDRALALFDIQPDYDLDVVYQLILNECKNTIAFVADGEDIPQFSAKSSPPG